MIDINPNHLGTVKAILSEHVPECEVRVFGSRATWTAKDYSDLDLAIVGAGPMDWGALGRLKEAFEESDLPMRVDVLDWHSISQSFRAAIERDYVVLQNRKSADGAGLLSEWREMPFSEAVLVNPTVRLTRGVTYPFVDMAAVNADFRSAYPSEQREFRGGGSRFHSGDTLMARITPCLENGKVARYRAPDAMSNAYGSTEFIVIRGRPNVTDNDFAYYLTQWNEVREYAISQMTGTSGRQRVPVGSLDHLTVPVPSLPEQRAIAHVLGTLDDKIDLNRRMNETLEAMARALFKSWFVDFDPVRAKAALITPPLRGSRQAKGARPPACAVGTADRSHADRQARRWVDVKRRYAPQTLQEARSLRQTRTDAGGLLWHFLRNKQLDGYKFRRQQPIGPYVADFACMSRKLLIQLDGSQHAERHVYDEKRDNFLQEKGYRILCFWNNEVFESCFGVLERVYEALTFPPPHQPSPVSSASATPLQGGSDWSVERARAYLPAARGLAQAGLDGMDDSFANLFPDRLVDSELGKIPEGWEVKELGDVADQRRFGVNPEEIDPDTPYIALEHMPKRCIALSEWDTADGLASSKFRFEQGDILFGKLRPYFHKVGVAPMDGVCSTDIVAVTPKSHDWFGFVLGHISSSEFVDYTDAGATGTKMPRTKWADMARYKIPLPDSYLVKAFTGLIQPCVDKVVSTIHESHDLAAHRDALLPKLVSGDVRVGEASPR